MWKRLPDSFHQPASVFLTPNFAETVTGRKRRTAGGVAAVGWVASLRIRGT